MTVAFAMIGCPTDGGGDDKKPDRTITFELGDPAGYDADTATVPAPVTVKDSTVLTLEYLKTVADVSGFAKDNYVFTRWQVKGTQTVISGSQTYKITSNITLIAIWEPPVTVTFIPWEDWDADDDDTENDYWPQEFIFANDTGFSDYEDYDFPKNPGITRTDLVFGKWVDPYGNTVDEDNTKFTADTIVTGVWYSTELEIDTGDAANDSVEKLYLENGSYAIYEFTLPTGKTISDVKEVKVDYKLSEAGMNRQVRNLRLMGPYIYNDFISHIAIDAGAKVPYFGDFVMDKNGAFAAKYNATDNATTYADNKNAPYINFNLNGASYANTAQSAFGDSYEIEANEWFTATYTFSNSTFTGTTVDRVNTTAHAPVATADTTKVYFGIGIPHPDKDKPNDDGVGAHNGTIQLVKDITLTFTEGTETVDGKVPDFGGTNGTQVFASYIDPIVFCWRGGATDPIAYPTSPANAVTEFPDLTAVDLGTFDATTGAGSFYVQLGNWETVTPSGANINATKVGATFTKYAGPLEVTFAANENNQRVNIGLLPDQITKLLEATGELTFTLDIDTPVPTTAFRYHLGNPLTGSAWNATSGTGKNFGDPKLSELVDGENQAQHCTNANHGEGDGTADDPHIWALTFELDENDDPTSEPVMETNNVQTFTANKSAATLGYFILQNRSATAATVKIKSIKIEYQVTPEVPAIPAKEDFTVFKSVTAGGSAPAVKMDMPSATWGALTDFNTAVPSIVFPKQDTTDQLTIRSYAKFDIKVKYYAADGSELTPVAGNQWAQCTFNGAINHYALGVEATGAAQNDGSLNVATSLGKYDTIKDESTLTLNWQRRDSSTPDTIASIELLEITFYAPEE